MNQQLTLDEKIRAIRSDFREKPAYLRKFNDEIRALKRNNPSMLNSYVNQFKLRIRLDNNA